MQSTTENTDLLRARTCYPQGYLDKPRFSNSNDRSKRLLPRASTIISSVKPPPAPTLSVHEDDKTTNKRSLVVKFQSKKIQKMNEEVDTKTNNFTTNVSISKDVLTNNNNLTNANEIMKEVDIKTNNLMTNDVSIFDEATMINDAKIGLKYIKKKNIAFTVLGPLCSLLNECNDFVKVILKDIIPIEVLTAFLVIKKADETFLRKEFRKNNISNHVYFVDKSLINKYTTSQLPHNIINVENSHSYKRGFLIDKIFNDNIINNNKITSTLHNEIVRLFLCMKYNLHNIIWVEESYSEIHKSYLFFNNFKLTPTKSNSYNSYNNSFTSTTSSGSSINDKSTLPFILYCRTPIPSYNVGVLGANSRCYYNSSIFTEYLAQIQNSHCSNPMDCFIVTKYSRDVFPNYQKIFSDYNEYWINTRILFNTTIIPFESQRSLEIFQMLSRSAVSIKSSTSNNITNTIIVLPTMWTFDIEVIYPFYYVITCDNNKVKYLRERPIHMKSDCESTSTKIKFDWNSLLLPVISQSDNEFGFWIPCNSFSFTLIKEQITEDWIDSVSYNVDDGWFLPLNNVLNRIVPINKVVLSSYSKHKLALRSIPLRATMPWIISKRNLTLENLSVVNNLPIIAIDTLAIRSAKDLKNILTLLSPTQDRNHSLTHDKIATKKSVGGIITTTQLITNFNRNQIFGSSQKNHTTSSPHNTTPVSSVSLRDLNQSLYLYVIKEERSPLSPPPSIVINDLIIADDSCNNSSTNGVVDRLLSKQHYEANNMVPIISQLGTHKVVAAKVEIDNEDILKSSSNGSNSNNGNSSNSNSSNNRSSNSSSSSSVVPMVESAVYFKPTKMMIRKTSTTLTSSINNNKIIQFPSRSTTTTNEGRIERFPEDTSSVIIANRNQSSEVVVVQEQLLTTFTTNNNINNDNNNENNNDDDNNTTTTNHNTTIQSDKLHDISSNSINILDNVELNHHQPSYSWIEIKTELQDLKNQHKKIDFQKYTKNALQLLDIDQVIVNNQHALDVFKLLQCHLQSNYNILPKQLVGILSAQVELSEAIKLLLEPAVN